MLQEITELDRFLLRLINQQWNHPFFDAILPFARNQYLWTPVYLFLLLFMVLNFRKQAFGWVLLFLLTFAVTDLISTQVIKEFIQRPRPCWDSITAGQVRMLIPCSHAYSFVSSHAANHFGIAAFLWVTYRHLQLRLLWMVWLWAALVAYAQVYVGAHFPFDILGGALLGWVAGNVMGRQYNRRFGLLQPN
jgi:undecaprenyl-diphosphatase